MLNHLHGADLWPGPLPRRYEAADFSDSYLLDLIEAAQPDYAVTGDKRSGLLQLDKLGRTKILSATAFSSHVLHLSFPITKGKPQGAKWTRKGQTLS